MVTRRNLLKLGAAAFAGRAAHGLNGIEDAVTEEQKGDPDDAYEYVTYSPNVISGQVTRPPNKALFERWDRDLPEAMIALGRSFIGCSRTSTPAQISDFLSLFNLPL